MNALWPVAWVVSCVHLRSLRSARPKGSLDVDDHHVLRAALRFRPVAPLQLFLFAALPSRMAHHCLAARRVRSSRRPRGAEF